jgi:hypothetical protein
MGARNARRGIPHHFNLLFALLVCSAAQLIPAVRFAQASEMPVYETVVVA